MPTLPTKKKRVRKKGKPKNKPFKPPASNSNVPLAGMGTFQNRDIELTWVGISERNGEPCALIDYRALLCLMIGDRLQHIHQVIRPALKAGKVVITDRYIFTQIVTTRTRGFHDEPWMYELYSHVPLPDLTLLLDARVEVAAERIRRRGNWRESFMELDHVEANLEEFRLLADRYDMLTVDTSAGDLDATKAVVGAALDELLA